jgi:hypothetical protein
MIRYLRVLLAAGLLGAAFVSPVEVAVVAVAGVVAEVGARVCYRVQTRRRPMDPGAFLEGVLDHGGELHRMDESIGAVLVPGADMTGRVTIPGRPDRAYRVRTDAAGFRRTAQDDRDAGRPVISVFGCSWTFGSALNDEDTFPWLLQASMPDVEVRTYGVGGYSLYQMLLRLEQSVAHDWPVAVVVAYLPPHNLRSVGALHEIPWFAAPYCHALADGQAGEGRLVRRPLRRAVLMAGWRHSYLIRSYVVNRARAGDTGDEVQQWTTEALFLAIRWVCEQAGAKLLIASLQHGNRHEDFLTRSGFSWVGALPDVLRPDPDGKYPWLILPYDNHANESANRLFAALISDALVRLLHGERVSPAPEYVRQNARSVAPPPAELENTYPLY